MGMSDDLQADIDAGRIHIMGDWLVLDRNGCTCFGGNAYGHEPGCGYEPIVKLHEAIMATSEPDVGVEE